jgi:hypothetical protein
MAHIDCQQGRQRPSSIWVRLSVIAKRQLLILNQDSNLWRGQGKEESRSLINICFCPNVAPMPLNYALNNG